MSTSFYTYHRLRGSEYGDTSFLWESETFCVVSPHSPRGQTPQPIFTQNGSIDVDSHKGVPFAVKIATFIPPDQGPKRSKFCKFLDLENFRSIWPLTLEVTERTPLILHRSSMKVA